MDRILLKSFWVAGFVSWVIPCTLYAHPGHGTISSDADPVSHYFFELEHLPWTMFVTGALVSAAWLALHRGWVLAPRKAK